MEASSPSDVFLCRDNIFVSILSYKDTQSLASTDSEATNIHMNLAAGILCQTKLFLEIQVSS